MSDRNKHLCLCTVYKCKDRRTADGQSGVLLSIRQFRTHQSREQRLQDQGSVERAQAHAIRVQEEAIVASMSSLSVDASPGVTIPTANKYRIDHVRRLVDSMSVLEQDAASLHQEVELVGAPQPGTVYPDENVQDRLALLCASRGRAKVMAQRLKITNHGEYRKDASVRAMREQATQALDELLDFIGRTERPWKDIILQRQAERDAFLADGGVEFNCCESNYH